MPHVEVTRSVATTPKETFALLQRMEDFPSFMSSVEEVSVLERTETTTRTRWRVKLQGSTFRWVEDDTFYPDEGRITYQQVQGDLRVFEGEWRIEPDAEGCRVTMTVDFEFGMPMLASLLNPIAKVILKKNVESMLDGFSKKGR